MRKYRFNDEVEFFLPDGYELDHSVDEDGDETYNILAGGYQNEDGEQLYRFICSVSLNEYDPKDAEEAGIESGQLLHTLTERLEGNRTMFLESSPEVVLVNKEMPLTVFGNMIKMYVNFSLIHVSEWAVLQMFVKRIFDDDEPEKNDDLYTYLDTVLRSVRINGKEIELGGLSAERMKKELSPSFDGSSETIDASPKISISIGDETSTYEYTDEGMKKVVNESDQEGYISPEGFSRTIPDESLHPHYDAMNTSGYNMLGALYGVNIVVNASGSEYMRESLLDLSDEQYNDYLDQSERELYERADAADGSDYHLDKEADRLSRVFRVNADVFDSGHDRECELYNGLMKRAYHFSALRSFAWTLADYCARKKCAPVDVSLDTLTDMADFVAGKKWLNYNDSGYCRGLCSGEDIEVCYVPDSILKDFRKAEIDAASLDSLRKDLQYVYPAVKTLCDELERTRDRSIQLEGNTADVVYAWCGVAKAARSPFKFVDGPMTYYYSQEDIMFWERREEEEKRRREEWKAKYTPYFEKKPTVIFRDKIFVFSGIEGEDDKESKWVRKVTDRGGLYRTKVSGKTDYLIVDPENAGSSKMDAVLEQRGKGHYVSVVRFDDFLELIGEERKKTSAEVSDPGVSSFTTFEKDTTTAEKMDVIRDLQSSLQGVSKEVEEAKEAMGDYLSYLKKTEEKEKAEKEEKEKKRAAAIALEDHEADTVNMFVILTNEEILGKKRRAFDDFYKIYEDDFPGMTKKAVRELRKNVQEQMKDDAFREGCASSFKRRSVAERFATSTRNLKVVGEGADVAGNAERAVEQTQNWYDPGEMDEVRRLMKEDLENARASLDSQILPISSDWGRFDTAKSYLHVVVRDKDDPNAEMEPGSSEFQNLLGDQQVSVQLLKKGMFTISITAMNCFPWYWNVSVRDIWQTALNNGIEDFRKKGGLAAETLVDQVIGQRFPGMKAERSFAEHAESSAHGSSAKKEGCYIATAVYGSYDAPQVMTLRRFRDDVLRQTGLGRWFIRTYYRYSPPIADRMKDAKIMNRLVRMALDQLVRFLDR